MADSTHARISHEFVDESHCTFALLTCKIYTLHVHVHMYMCICTCTCTCTWFYTGVFVSGRKTMIIVIHLTMRLLYLFFDIILVTDQTRCPGKCNFVQTKRRNVQKRPIAGHYLKHCMHVHVSLYVYTHLHVLTVANSCGSLPYFSIS